MRVSSSYGSQLYPRGVGRNFLSCEYLHLSVDECFTIRHECLDLLCGCGFARVRLGAWAMKRCCLLCVCVLSLFLSRFLLLFLLLFIFYLSFSFSFSCFLFSFSCFFDGFETFVDNLPSLSSLLDCFLYCVLFFFFFVFLPSCRGHENKHKTKKKKK